MCVVAVTAANYDAQNWINCIVLNVHIYICIVFFTSRFHFVFLLNTCCSREFRLFATRCSLNWQRERAFPCCTENIFSTVLPSSGASWICEWQSVIGWRQWFDVLTLCIPLGCLVCLLSFWRRWLAAVIWCRQRYPPKSFPGCLATLSSRNYGTLATMVRSQRSPFYYYYYYCSVQASSLGGYKRVPTTHAHTHTHTHTYTNIYIYIYIYICSHICWPRDYAWILVHMHLVAMWRGTMVCDGIDDLSFSASLVIEINWRPWGKNSTTHRMATFGNRRKTKPNFKRQLASYNEVGEWMTVYDPLRTYQARSSLRVVIISEFGKYWYARWHHHWSARRRSRQLLCDYCNILIVYWSLELRESLRANTTTANTDVIGRRCL